MGLESYFEAFGRRDWQTADPDGTVRLAIVGTGGFARNRALPAIEAGDYCDSSVLVTGSPESAAGIADQFDAEAVMYYDAFLDGHATDTYDAVYVATPNVTHGEYAIAAADWGKHVICDKPLETTVRRTRDQSCGCGEEREQ